MFLGSRFGILPAPQCKLLILKWLKCDVYHRTPAPKAGSAAGPESSVFNYLRFNHLRAAC